MKPGQYPKMETALVAWMHEARAANMSLSGTLLKSQPHLRSGSTFSMLRRKMSSNDRTTSTRGPRPAVFADAGYDNEQLQYIPEAEDIQQRPCKMYQAAH